MPDWLKDLSEYILGSHWPYGLLGVLFLLLIYFQWEKIVYLCRVLKYRRFSLCLDKIDYSIGSDESLIVGFRNISPFRSIRFKPFFAIHTEHLIFCFYMESSLLEEIFNCSSSDAELAVCFRDLNGGIAVDNECFVMPPNGRCEIRIRIPKYFKIIHVNTLNSVRMPNFFYPFNLEVHLCNDKKYVFSSLKIAKYSLGEVFDLTYSTFESRKKDMNGKISFVSNIRKP